MTNDLFSPNKIRTYTGLWIDVSNPDPDTICIEDMAHALSKEGRFSNHLEDHYSVAQHCLNCVTSSPTEEMKLPLLMHDSPEYILRDIASPIKKLLPQYKSLENAHLAVIAKKFGFSLPFDPKIKEIDMYWLKVEWFTLMLKDKSSEFYRADLIPMSQKEAKQAFLDKYYELTSKR